jgi:16S rRNA (adenine1518-N6/adenine1519-N6)-dimethyltransferase
MLQKEMVERLLAKIRTHQYNAFSVFIQSLAGIKQIMVVSKTCFYPIPEVDSVVIQIVKKITSIKIDDYDVFLKRCFLSKRKTLVNNLLHSKIDKERLLQFLAKHNLSPLTRAEELNVEHFQELFNI